MTYCFRPLLVDGLKVLADAIARELQADKLSRTELIELCQLAWRQIEPKSCQVGRVVEAIRDPLGKESDVLESLCAEESSRAPGWLEWLATVYACCTLLWATDPFLANPHSHPWRSLGREWLVPSS